MFVEKLDNEEKNTTENMETMNVRLYEKLKKEIKGRNKIKERIDHYVALNKKHFVYFSAKDNSNDNMHYCYDLLGENRSMSIKAAEEIFELTKYGESLTNLLSRKFISPYTIVIKKNDGYKIEIHWK